jgi:hypothetical protein
MFTEIEVLQVVLRSIGMPPTLTEPGESEPPEQPGQETLMAETLGTPLLMEIETLARTVWSVAPAAFLAAVGLPSRELLTRFMNLLVTSESHSPPEGGATVVGPGPAGSAVSRLPVLRPPEPDVAGAAPLRVGQSASQNAVSPDVHDSVTVIVPREYTPFGVVGAMYAP